MYLTVPESDTAIIRHHLDVRPVITAKTINVGCHRHTDVTVDSRAESGGCPHDVTHRFTGNIDVKRNATVTKNGVENETTETVIGVKIHEAGKLILRELIKTYCSTSH